MTVQKPRNTLAMMLLAVSLLSLGPSITVADQQRQYVSITINASGQALPIRGKGQSAQASLHLTGLVNMEANGELKIKNLAGSLTIGSVTFQLSNGHGESYNKGKLEIQAKASGPEEDENEVDLHGTIEGNSVVFDSPESKLSSLYLLSLSGQAGTTIIITSSTNINALTQTVTVTTAVNSTLTKTTTTAANSTLTKTTT